MLLRVLALDWICPSRTFRQAVMPLPYKSPDAAFTQFVQHVEELGQRLGGTANTQVAEGRADAPVGTTLALIEQAMKPVGAVDKRLHASQAREFALLKERFRDDPEGPSGASISDQHSHGRRISLFRH